MPSAPSLPPSLITLTTDFGTGWHVGAVKGTILRVNPRAVIVDLTHGITPMNVLEGAFALAAAAGEFPEGTIHVAVVDPGVGTARRGLIVETACFRFVAPDNGLLSLAAPGVSVKRAFTIENPQFFASRPSATFHGRDVFAPVAAHLSLGVDPCEMGPPATDLTVLALPEVVQEGNGWQGEILFADRFGNLVTNVRGDLARSPRDAQIWVGDEKIGRLLRTYGEVPPGHALALVGSHGYLEIAVNGGSAREKLGVGPGGKVRMR